MDNAPAKRRRLPSRQACIGCRGRKHRCDGARPECGGCRSRNITCRYASDATSPTHVEGTRISNYSAPRVHDLPFAGEQHHGAQSRQSQQPAQASPLSSRTSVERTESLNLLWGASTDLLRGPRDIVPLSRPVPYQANRPTHPAVSAERQNFPSNISSPGDSGGPNGYFGDSSTFAFVSKVQPESQNVNGVHLQNEKSIGSSASQNGRPLLGSDFHSRGDSETIYQLPERHLADSLVDGYFDRVHPLYPFLHEGSFRAEYENTWTYVPQSTFRPSWYALLNIVFALGCEFCDAIPEGRVGFTAPPFVDRSRDIILSRIYRKGNLEFVQALLLMCHYLQGTLELNECWNLVGLMTRTAVSIGLQLNPEALSLTTVEREVRKRVWWGCFIIDRTLSMKFGRPRSIQTADALDVPLPLSVDDQYIHSESSSPRQPAGRPSVMAFFIHTIKLSHVIEKILHDLYTTTKTTSQRSNADTLLPTSSDQSEILSRAVPLDGQLRSWWNDVPTHLRLGSTAVDGEIFQRQQTVMQIRYLQIRILLQRPLLLIFSRQQIEDDFLQAIAIAGSKTCIYGARQTVRMIYSQYHRGLLNSLWYNLHYIFTSMGVLLHVQMMDKSRLELLGYGQEEETLEWGMEFLKAASSTSDLAARYAAMLQRVQNQMKQVNPQGGGVQARELGADSLQTPNPDVPHHAPLASPGNGLHSSQEVIDLDGMDLDDLLFGTGLPQSVLSFDYPNGGFLL